MSLFLEFVHLLCIFSPSFCWAPLPLVAPPPETRGQHAAVRHRKAPSCLSKERQTPPVHPAGCRHRLVDVDGGILWEPLGRSKEKAEDEWMYRPGPTTPSLSEWSVQMVVAAVFFYSGLPSCWRDVMLTVRQCDWQ